VPEALIREECLTELELIAGMIRERGPATAFQAISQVAQCGTIAIANRLRDSGFKEQFLNQMENIQNEEFSKLFRSQDWRLQAKELVQNLKGWEERLNRVNTQELIE